MAPSQLTLTLKTVGDTEIIVTVDGDAGITNEVFYKTRGGATSSGGTLVGDGDIIISSLTNGINYEIWGASRVAGESDEYGLSSGSIFVTPRDADTDTFVSSLVLFIRDDLRSNITDPLSRASGFVMTSYPKRQVQYPIITIKTSNVSAKRAGMQTSRMDVSLTIEVRVWARNEKEKDELYQQLIERLSSIQFAAGGSVANDYHDFNVLGSTDIDEDGDNGIKSRIAITQFNFFDLQ